MKILQVAFLLLFNYLDSLPKLYLFIGPQEFVVGYFKAPEQPQSSARPTCHSHAMTRMGANQPPYALLHRSSLRYTLRHGRRMCRNVKRTIYRLS